MRRSEYGARGFRCSRSKVSSAPVVEIAVKAADMQPGDLLEVLGDCPTFERDVRTWRERLDKVVLSVKNEGGSRKRIQIQL